MAKLELEVKILDINTTEFRKKIEKLGAKLKEETKQVLYTYDLPTIYGRFIDLICQLKDSDNNIKLETIKAKYMLWAFEIDNLLFFQDKEMLYKLTHKYSFSEIGNEKDILKILDNEYLIKFVEKFHNNFKKWIRVRETNGHVTITVKHILTPNSSCLQQMQETEIKVASLEDANQLLQALGYSYKSYQEKKRVSYIFDEHEIEGKNEEDLKNILKKLGYDIKDAVSCTADQVYEMYGKSMFQIRELKFENEKEVNN